MSVTITDPKLLEHLRHVGEAVDLVDPDGRVLGVFSTAEGGRLPRGIVSPFTEADMSERSKNRSGRPHADILRELQDRG